MAKTVPTTKVNNPSDIESDEMDRKWREFDRDHRHCAPQLTVDEIHKWEDWAMEHFGA